MRITVPPIFYVKAFWNAVAGIIAGVLSLLVVLEVLSPMYALDAGVLLVWILTILEIFKITPQLRAVREALGTNAKKTRKSK